MSWKLYALASGGAFLATYLVSPALLPKTRQDVPIPSPRVVDRSGAAVNLAEQADRLRTRLAETTSYREPRRDAFQFGTVPRRVSLPPPTTSPEGDAAAIASPPRPPFALAGIAGDAPGGVAGRTAVLSSLRGVLLVREGDVVEDAYRVVRIEEEAVTVEAIGDGTRTTLRLSGSDPR